MGSAPIRRSWRLPWEQSTSWGDVQYLVKGNEAESTAHLEFKINYQLGASQKEKVLTLKMTLSSALF